MKALLVADDEKAINNISEVLKSAGYDTIVYRWLLKALDNIEEVAPHLIVVSTGDYPRHWKTLAQYSTIGFGDYKPQIILYTDENFNQEEAEKAEALHVRGTFDSVEVEGLDKLREILKKADDIFSGYLTEEEQAEISVDDLVPHAKKYFEAKLKEEPAEEDAPVDKEITEAEAVNDEEIIEAEAEEEPVEEKVIEAEIEEEISETLPEDVPVEEESIEDQPEDVPAEEESVESEPEDVPVEEDLSEDESKTAEEESFDQLVTKFEETNSYSDEPSLEDIQEAEEEALADEDAANRLEEIENDEKAADRLEEITGDEVAADRLEEIADEEAAADRLARISENEELTENDEVMTVDSIMSEPYDESESTALPGIDELKKLLEENNFEESVNNAIIEETQEKEDGETTMADEQSIDEKLAAIMNANKADQKERAEALKLDTSTSSVSFVFTNPITLAMVSGVARNYNGLVLEFTPDIPGFIMNLSPGTKIDIASMKIDDKIENVFAEVMSNDAKKLALAIKKIS